jgi:RimJ/RimL family protein N-acetyltransferase
MPAPHTGDLPRIRRLNIETDVHGYVRLVSQAEPSPLTADDWRERQRRAHPGAYRRFLVGELDGEIVVAGSLLDSGLMANGVAARIVVDAAHRGRGYGTAMAAALDALVAERVPASVEVRIQDTDPASRAWAEARGFRLQRHMVRSRLELPGFDAARHRPAVERAEAAGLRFEPVGDDEVDRLYELYAALISGMPEELDPQPLEAFRHQYGGRPGQVRLVVRDGATWAGMALAQPQGADGAWNAFTGVLAAYRGRGLATALKVLALERLQRDGRAWIETANTVGNAPMLAVNRALGYRPVAGILFLRRPA